jgi:hypothetical protein
VAIGESNAAGVYTLPQLQEGNYVVKARGQGFKEFVAVGIALVSREQRRLDITMQVGAVETTVEVQGGVSLIETETARISDTKSGSTLNALPHNTRSLWNFLGLTPGVVKGAGTSSTIRFAGSRDNQAAYTFDGTTITDPNSSVQMTPLVAHIEAFQEVRVDMANNSAEFAGIGQVSIVSKSGTNQMHGSGFGYYSSPFLRARNPFAPAREGGLVYTAGASVGGPVRKNKTFFYYAYETIRGSAVQQLLNPTVPLASWRNGDFGATVVRDPQAGNAPFAGNRIPAGRLNAVSLKVQERFYPVPNVGAGTVLQPQNYLELKTRPRDPTFNHNVRGDHHFSPKSFVFGRWSWVRLYNRPFEANLPGVGQRDQVRDQYSFNTSYTYQFRTNLINEFRYGFARNINPLGGPVNGPALVKELGLRGLSPELPEISGIFKVAFTGLGITAITQTDWSRNNYYTHQFTDHLSWFRGKHTVKTGFIVGRVDGYNVPGQGNLFGNMNFSNRYTGHPYGDFLLGVPTTSSRAFPSVPIAQKRQSYEAFVTDEWKVLPQLTVSLGARYQLVPAYREGGGQLAVFDIASGRIVVPDGSLGKVSPLMPRAYVDVVEAKTAGIAGGRLIAADRNDVAPRIGLAWRPFGNQTVFRAGYGIFYDVTPRNANAGGIPFSINEPAYTNPAVANVVLPAVFPASISGPTTVALPTAIRSDIRTPYSMQYNATVEHQRWNTGFRVSYIGTNTRQGHWRYDINSPVPDGRLYVDKARMFPRYPAISYVTNGAGHQYHAGTVEIERRMAQGLYFQFSYTLARDIGDLERNEAPENSYDRRRERAVWQDIPTHRVTGNFIYQLPVGKGRKWVNGSRVLDAVIGGWELSGIYNYNSGEFLTPLWTGPDPTGTVFTASRTPAQVTIRPNILRDPNLDDPTTRRWFDVGAFGAPSAGSFGTSAKGVIKGPNVNIVHAGLAKQFELRETMRLRLEVTSMNFFNHPSWGNPETNITQAASAGVINSIGGVSALDQIGPRVFRVGMRLEF